MAMIEEITYVDAEYSITFCLYSDYFIGGETFYSLGHTVNRRLQNVRDRTIYFDIVRKFQPDYIKAIEERGWKSVQVDGWYFYQKRGGK